MPEPNDAPEDLQRKIEGLKTQVEALQAQLTKKARVEAVLKETVHELHTHQEELRTRNENLIKDITTCKRAEEKIHIELTIRSALGELYPQMISPASSLADIAAKILEHAKHLTGSPHGYVLMIDPQSQDNTWRLLASLPEGECRHSAPDHRAMFAKDAHGQYAALCGHALNTGRAFYTNSPARHPASSGISKDHIALHRFLSVPVMLGEKPAGQIALANKELDYSDQDLEAMQRLADIYALAIQRVRFVEQIKASLQEKEVLLQEIHHRVKNNMQVICSLLNLQAASIDDPRLKEFLSESRGRINAMAMIHETLYQSNSISRLDLKTYVRNLASALIRMYETSASRISLKVQTEPIHLTIDQAVPCGLVIHELVANAYKHAFPEDRRGEIKIEAFGLDQNRMGLIVSDDGVGLPVAFDPQHGKGLGLKLVTGLVEVQLDGTILIEREPGTRFTIQFPANRPKEEGSI